MNAASLPVNRPIHHEYQRIGTSLDNRDREGSADAISTADDHDSLRCHGGM